MLRVEADGLSIRFNDAFPLITTAVVNALPAHRSALRPRDAARRPVTGVAQAPVRSAAKQTAADNIAVRTSSGEEGLSPRDKRTFAAGVASRGCPRDLELTTTFQDAETRCNSVTMWKSNVDAVLEAFPEDEESATQGRVDAQISVLRDTTDSGVRIWSGIWTAQPSTLELTFPDETMHVLQGSALVKVDNDEVLLRPGDLISFAAGQSATLKILEPFKMFFVVVLPAT